MRVEGTTSRRKRNGTTGSASIIITLLVFIHDHQRQLSVFSTRLLRPSVVYNPCAVALQYSRNLTHIQAKRREVRSNMYHEYMRAACILANSETVTTYNVAGSRTRALSYLYTVFHATPLNVYRISKSPTLDKLSSTFRVTEAYQR